MNISSIINNINRIEREIIPIERQKSQETDKELRINKEIDRLTSEINKSTNLSSTQSKLNQLRNKQAELGRIDKKKIQLAQRISTKNTQLRKYQTDLQKAEEKERKDQEKERKKIEREQMEFQRNLNLELERHKRLSNQISEDSKSLQTKNEKVKKYDVFISHATPDKEDFVRPLATALQELNVRVWYDEFELELGDSLRRSIDKGLINSRFGIVVLSTSFFKRNWTQYELDGFVNREMNGLKVILPIWHKVSKDEVQNFSPSLADKVALNTSIYSIKEIAKEIEKLVT